MQMRPVLAALSLAGTALLAPSQPDANGSCGWERCFGAMAVGESGAIGRAAGFITLPEAAASAQNRCGSGCRDVEVFWNACGVVAMASDGTWQFGWDPELTLAQDKALAACTAGGGRGCYVRDWVCSK